MAVVVRSLSDMRIMVANTSLLGAGNIGPDATQYASQHNICCNELIVF